MTLRSRLAARDEEGTALILALLFLTICAVAIAGLLTFSSTSSNATIALRTARGNDYDAQATMQAAIATIRKGDACTTNVSYTPTWTLNNPSAPLRADCYVQSASSAQRNDVLLVCRTTAPTPCDSQALLRANVIFYDTPSVGASIGIQTWSNQ
jgi:hypothetical protein